MTTYINARCHCGLNKFKVAFHTDSLPITIGICHCNSCRHSSGQLGYSVIRIDGVPLSPNSETDEPADLSTLTGYKSSERATRHFCKKCSAHMFWEEHGKADHFSVSAGSLERIAGIAKVGYHIFVGDTLDGGLADHYRTFEGTELPRYLNADGNDAATVPAGWRSSILDRKQESEEQGEERLELYCHCKKNQFYITRVTECVDPEKEWWILPGGDGKPIKLRAAHCVCTSCRLSSGFEIQSWSYFPQENILNPDTCAPINFRDVDKRPKGLTQYASTPGGEIYREFCGTCGATMFYWRTTRDVIDVSLGVLDQERWGARAEEWLDWETSQVVYEQDAINTSLLEALKEGIKKVEV